MGLLLRAVGSVFVQRYALVMMNTQNYNAERIQTSSEWTPERVALVGRHAVLVVVGGVAFGLFAAVMKLYWLSAAIGGLLLVGLVAWQFESALVLYALMAFLPFGKTPDLATGGSGVGKGVYVSEIMLAFLLGVWFLKYVTGALPRNRIHSAFYVPMGLYLVYCLINVWNSFLFWDFHVNHRYQYRTVNFIEIVLHALSVGALLMMATSIGSRKWLNRVTMALLAACAYNYFNALLGERIPIQAPWWSLLTLLPVAYLCVIALDSGLSKLKRGLAVGAVALAVFVVFVQGISWVSGWLGLFTAIGTVTFIKNRKTFLVLLVITVLMCTVAWPFLHKNVVESSRTEGDYDRFAMMRGALIYASQFPLGVGLGNYRTYNTFYYGEKWGTTSYTSSHGTYSQHLSEMGFPGLVLFGVLLVLGFRWMLANYREMQPGASKTYVLAAMGQLVGISVAAFIGDYIVPTYHNGGIVTFSTTVYSWLIWGLAIAHVRISRNEADGSLDCHS